MRLFIAIAANELNFDPQVALKKLKVNLNRKAWEYRWVPQENYHITLNFLGEIPKERLSELQTMLHELVQHHVYFHLKLHGLGVFPEIREGRVIWMGVQNSLALRSLQEDCESRLRDLGFDLEEKSYVPHLTLARLRNPKGLSDVISPLENTRFGELEVKSVVLYESQLTGSFPVYMPLFRFPLKEP